VLADGMGGHVGGAAASSIAVKTAIDNFEAIDGDQASRLTQSIHLANDAVANEISQSPKLDGMGCTLVVASIQGDQLHYASVGDSPFWVWRKGDMLRVNADHSMVPVLSDLVDAGRMTEEEAATDSRRNSLRSAIMGEEISLLDFNEGPILLDRDDILILASDGLETLSVAEISRIVGNSRSDMEGLAATLLMEVERRNSPNQDNVTILCSRAPTESRHGGGLYSEQSSRDDQTTIRIPPAAMNAPPRSSSQGQNEENGHEEVAPTRSAASNSGILIRNIVIGILVLAILILAFILLRETGVKPDNNVPLETSQPAETPELNGTQDPEESGQETLPNEAAERAFDEAIENRRIQDFGLFARDYPEHSRVTEVDELAWNSARRQNSIEAFQAYLNFFPDGEFTDRARESVSRLELEERRQTEEQIRPPNSEGPEMSDADRDAARAVEEKSNRLLEDSDSPRDNTKDSLDGIDFDRPLEGNEADQRDETFGDIERPFDEDIDREGELDQTPENLEAPDDFPPLDEILFPPDTSTNPDD